LPTEAEWEFAARSGFDGAEFAWGNELTPLGKTMANTWQGAFPHENLKLDGYERTSPVTAFPPNGYGLYHMIGNVWEWTTDWYSAKDESNADKAVASRSIRGAVVSKRATTPASPKSRSLARC
jgi:formylglycine-generating enzyme